MRPNKLEGLSLETLSSQVLEFEARPEPTQLEHLSDASVSAVSLPPGDVKFAHLACPWNYVIFCLYQE